MRRKLYAPVLFLLTNLSLFSQAPNIEWETNLGGSDWDIAFSIQQTNDGGYIVAGFTESVDGDVNGNNGNSDFWIVKLDNTGGVLWDKNLGGSGFDDAYSIKQTMDAGFIIAGATLSNDGDVGGNNGGADFWIVKLNHIGEIQWEKSLGGSGWDIARSIEQTTDGGYIVAGFSDSLDGDVSGNNGEIDFWVVKLNPVGSIEWEKSLGGSGIDYATCVQQTTDGGYIVSGVSNSNDGDVIGNYGNEDFWVVKLDNIGNIQWEKNYGGSGYDVARSIQQTTDNGYIVVGLTESTNGDVSENNGGADFWVVKLNHIGEIQWEKALGGSDWDAANSVRQTIDGGFIVAGVSVSNNGDVGGNQGEGDFWITKLDSSGNLLWEKSIGGSAWDEASSVRATTDGGYIVAGGSASNDGDVGGNHGIVDFWIVKLEAETLTITENPVEGLSLYPNPTKDFIYLQSDKEIENVAIYNYRGQKIDMPLKYTKKNPIDLSGFSSGVYFIEITIKGQTGIYKIIKK